MPDKYIREAEKLLPKKKEHQTYCRSHQGENFECNCMDPGYNKAREEDTPIVAKLLKQVDELKKNNECYTCGSLDSGPRYCIECYSKLEKKIEEEKDE